MADRISVIVPAYNGAPWLPKCLDSLLAQTYDNMEIIVVNDGSQDGTKEVLDGYAARYDAIKAIHQENRGVTAARLSGLKEASGDWIGFVDGDDVVEKQMFARLLENAHAYAADISHCGHQVCFPDGRVTQICDDGHFRPQDRITGLRDLLDGGLVESSLCTKLYRRALFDGLEDWMDRSVKNNEDLLMNFYLFGRARQSVFEAVCPYHYLLREGSASYQRPPLLRIIQDQIKVRQIMLECCDEKLRDDVRRAQARNALFLYAWLTMFPQREYDEGRTLVRALLKDNRACFGLLSRRNMLLANMICTCPWAFRLAYGLYAKLKGQEDH